MPTIAARSTLPIISADDVVVVVGGGRGIAAECALRIGGRGAAIVLVGRSAADTPDVAATLARAAQNGLTCRYVSADVLDRDGLAAALAAPLGELGPATTLVYAPALNEPGRLTDLDADTARRTLAPKTQGLETILDVLGPALRRIVTFGSIIGVIGLEGEAHYALANGMQTAAAAAWAVAKDGRNALSIEWSVWGGIGMGERLGTIERLATKGVDALSVDDALDAFDQLIDGNATGTIAVTSRFGPPPDLSLGPFELPLLRFVDEPQVLFPGVEAVFETKLSRGRDCYLEDHTVDGDQIFPGVLALEAMAQVASVLQPICAPVIISDVRFKRPVIVESVGSLRIRIAALRGTDGKVEAALFAEDDGFAVACMRASFGRGQIRFDRTITSEEQRGGSFPAAALYGPLFFGSGRFRRIDRFTRATSRAVEALLAPPGKDRWFGPFEADTTILWPPGATDAALHALQVAVPHRRVLPVEVDRIELLRSDSELARVTAVERSACAGTYVFDLAVWDAEDNVIQRWIGAKFQAVGDIKPVATLTAVPDVAAIYLERLARELIGDDTVRVAVVQDEGKAREWRRAAALRLLNLEGNVDRRQDGSPLRKDGRGSVSFAHRDGITLAVTAGRRIGCDIEAGARADVDERSGMLIECLVATEAWRKLGCRTPSFAPGRISAKNPVVCGGIHLLIVELPTPLGIHTIALGSRDPEMISGAAVDLPMLERTVS